MGAKKKKIDNDNNEVTLSTDSSTTNADTAIVMNTNEVPVVFQKENKKLNIIQKVKLMNSLVSLTEDQEFLKLIKSKPDGDLILDIFANAIESKLKTLMSGEDDDGNSIPESVDNLSEKTKLASEEMVRLIDGIRNISNSGILTELAKMSNAYAKIIENHNAANSDGEF